MLAPTSYCLSAQIGPLDVWLLVVSAHSCYTNRSIASTSCHRTFHVVANTQGNAVISVHALLPRARERLIVISSVAPVVEAARLLSVAHTGLVVVCNTEGQISGVVTKADVVREISTCTGCSCTTRVSDIMTEEVVFCTPGQALSDVWASMKKTSLKQIPVIDDSLRPLGVLYANDALETLLNEVEDNEVFLRDYVMGVGYR